MHPAKIVVIGAGVGGLVSALELARAGFEVTVLERQPKAGGKMREVVAGGRPIDAGPTVFTMRWVFEQIFRDAGSSLEAEVQLRPLDILARHAWSGGARLDLYADAERSAEAIGEFAGAREAQGFREFCRRARDVYTTLEGPFIRSAQPSPISLAMGAGLKGLGDLWRISPFTTLWSALGDHFRDPRLRQLFGRYATYCGSSPFLAPATLMLVAHVEQDGVWIIEGGMARLADALMRAGERAGAAYRFGAHVEEVLTDRAGVTGVRLASGEVVPASAVVANADSAAVAEGLLGSAIARAVPHLPPRQRSLSALTWVTTAKTEGFPLVRHNVFFSDAYEREFDDILDSGRLPGDPTVYVCAEDRAGSETLPEGPERLLCLVNAPAVGDTESLSQSEIAQCEERMFRRLAASGLRVDRDAERVLTGPREFNALFPATGGALYGPASHGWSASFSRPSARTRVPGLYLAGGSTHPGPGVPMAALSGWLAAAHVKADLISVSPSRVAAMPGGTSTR